MVPRKGSPGAAGSGCTQLAGTRGHGQGSASARREQVPWAPAQAGICSFQRTSKSQEELAGRKQRPNAMSKPCGAPAGRGQEMSPALRGAGRERGSAVPIPSTGQKGGHKAARVDAAAPAAKRALSWALQHLPSWGRGGSAEGSPFPMQRPRSC